MQVRAIRDGVRLEFPSGDVLTIGTKPTIVPKEFESEVRRTVMVAKVHGVEIVPEAKPVADEKKGDV